MPDMTLGYDPNWIDQLQSMLAEPKWPMRKISTLKAKLGCDDEQLRLLLRQVGATRMGEHDEYAIIISNWVTQQVWTGAFHVAKVYRD